MITVFDKSYYGFESTIDIEQDIGEMLQESASSGEIPPEFQGTLRVVITYEPEE